MTDLLKNSLTPDAAAPGVVEMKHEVSGGNDTTATAENSVKNNTAEEGAVLKNTTTTAAMGDAKANETSWDTTNANETFKELNQNMQVIFFVMNCDKYNFVNHKG